jgi:mono/diheme cytochrome c family protein
MRTDFLFSAAAVAAALALVSASSTALGQTPAGSAQAGKKAYLDKMCHTCHGTLGQGGERSSGPRIAPQPYPWEAFAMQVRRPRAAMPRFPAEFLTDRELADIYAYLSAIKPGPNAGDIPLLRD